MVSAGHAVITLLATMVVPERAVSVALPTPDPLRVTMVEVFVDELSSKRLGSLTVQYMGFGGVKDNVN